MNRDERRRQARQARRAVTSVGGMHDRDAAVVDTRGAVLLDEQWTVMVHTGAAGDVVGLELAGRVNKSTARASTFYLLDLEGAAKLAADLVSLAARYAATGEDAAAAAETFRATFDAQLTAGTATP